MGLSVHRVALHEDLHKRLRDEGGPGYLLNFCHPRSIAENTMRRGFTPDIG